MTASNHLMDHGDGPNELVQHVASATVPTAYGDFVAHAYRSTTDGREHLAYVFGHPGEVDAPLVRLHSECLTGDVLGSLRCDCGQQLDMALAAIVEAGAGVLVYLRGHEGRGIGLANKIQAYALQDGEGLDTVDANTAQGLPVDARTYEGAAAILLDLGITKLRIMTNNPEKISALEAAGVVIEEQIVLQTGRTDANSRYLDTKRDRLGHDLR